MLLVVLLFGAVAGAQSPQAPVPSPGGPPAPVPPEATAGMTDEQKTVYALGLLMQRSIRQFDLSAEEIEIVKRALTEGAAGKPAVDLTEWGPTVEPLANVRRVRATAREKAASAAYLDTAAAEIGAVRTPSGLVYRNITIGTGPSPTARDTVRVHYRGTLIDGTVFDSSYDRSEPTAFRLDDVVPCWTEGVQRMRVGGKARLVCSSDLAYGDAGNPAIPGGAALVFEVELLEIIGSAPAAPAR
jgi:FKBP-type peptidyl-prolyl cis-trans isomerase FkpA